MDTHSQQDDRVFTEQGVHGKDGETHGRIPIFIDEVRHFAPQPTMYGAELKALGQVPAEYQLFLEVPGPAPDIGIRDDEAVEMKPAMRFVSVVPGTLGAGQ